MRHRKTGRKLNINSSHRKAMFRNMVTSLFKHDRIRTTDSKAKELRSLADRLVTLAKRGDLHARRQVLSIVREKDVVHKLFEEAGERFGSVAGGYTRIVKIGRRPGDAAPMSLIELVSPGAEGGKKSKKKKPVPVAGSAAAPKPAEPVAEASEPESGAESFDEVKDDTSPEPADSEAKPAEAMEGEESDKTPSGDDGPVDEATGKDDVDK